MLGTKDKNFKTHTAVSLEGLVPGDNFYRQVEECLDLHFVRDLVHGLYSPIGRPSIDPVLFFKLQLIAFPFLSWVPSKYGIEIRSPARSG